MATALASLFAPTLWESAKSGLKYLGKQLLYKTASKATDIASNVITRPAQTIFKGTRQLCSQPKRYYSSYKKKSYSRKYKKY